MLSTDLVNVPAVALHGRKRYTVSGSLAANAGATVVGSVPVPTNTLVFVEVKVRMYAGATGPLAVVLDAAADSATLVAHGLVTGQPVMVVGSSQPGGFTASTVYYGRAATADTITFYDTKVHAAAGGGTGLVDITSIGTAVVVTPVALNAAYVVQAAGHNRATIATLVGSANAAVTMEDVAAWNATVAINNTNKTLDVQITPDVDLATRFDVEVISDTNSAAG